MSWQCNRCNHWTPDGLEHECIYDKFDELKEYFMHMLGQGCGTYNRDKELMEYDHMCLSAYEHALRFAIEHGWIKESQLTRGL